jgi:hypothetical protein
LRNGWDSKDCVHADTKRKMITVLALSEFVAWREDSAGRLRR